MTVSVFRVYNIFSATEVLQCNISRQCKRDRKSARTFSRAHSLRFRLLRASALILRPKIAGFFRERMEKGGHLASYAYEYVPRSRPLFAEDTRPKREVFPSKNTFLRILLSWERKSKRESERRKRRRLLALGITASGGAAKAWQKRRMLKEQRRTPTSVDYEGTSDFVEGYMRSRSGKISCRLLRYSSHK